MELVTHRPSTASDEDIYTDAGDGTVYANPSAFPVVATNQKLILGNNPLAQACLDLTSQLSNDWFAIGIRIDIEDEDRSDIYAEEYASVDPAPTLYVEYVINPVSQITFIGLYYENGTSAGVVNVSAYCPSETEIFELNGTIIKYFEEKPTQISWGLLGGVYRKIYVHNNTETHYIYTPDGDYSVYPFYVKDYCGYLGVGDCFLESLRIVDGVERLIERVKIQDSITSVPLILTHYKIYILQVRTSYDIYRFGYYTPEVDSTWTLRLKGISFSQNIAMSSKDVIMEGTRPNATYIKGTFLDEKDETTFVKFEVWYRSNYTVAYIDNSTSNPVQFNWYGANNETDYIAHLEITHPRLPNLERNFPLTGVQSSFSSAPNLGIIGTWGPLDSAFIFPVIILLIVGSLTDERNAEVGAFIMWCIAAGMSYIGWYPNSGAKLIVALIFIFLIGLGKRRGK